MGFNKDMRLIGDYIFLHQQNYQQKGGIQEAIENQAAKRMAITNSLPEGLEQQTEQFENIISSLINPDKQDDAIVQKIWQSVEKKLQEEFPYMAKEGIDRQFLTYNHIKGVENSIKESLETTKVKIAKIETNRKSHIKITTIKSRIEGLKQMLANSNGVFTDKQKVQVQELIAEFDKLVKDTKEVDQNNCQIWKSDDKGNQLASRQDFLNRLNQTISILRVNENLIKGTLWEYLSAAAFSYILQGSSKKLEKAIKETVIGDVRSSITYKQGDFFRGANFNKMFNLKTPTGTTYTTNPSQDKIDIKVNVNGIDYGISAKNVTLKSNGIHLLSGASLMGLLYSMNNPIFVNHYLNLSSLQKVSLGEDTQSEITASPLRQQALNELQATIALQAFVGHKQGVQKASHFLVFESSSKTVELLGIKQILNQLDLTQMKITNQNHTKLTDIIFSNSPYQYEDGELSQASAEIRINNLLNEVHRQKINAIYFPKKR